jgi:hypothetical protein
MTRSLRRSATIGALAATSAALAALAGCGSTSTAQPAPVSQQVPTSVAVQPSGTTSAAATTPPPASPAAAGTTAKPGGSGLPPNCTTADLRITAGQFDAATGHGEENIIFHNTGSTPCRIHAYPGVAEVNAQGKQIAQATRTLDLFMGGLKSGEPMPDVTLQPGQDASDLVGGSDQAGDAPCSQYAGLLVTPPNDTHSVRVPLLNNNYCAGFGVTPVVPGDKGRDSF